MTPAPAGGSDEDRLEYLEERVASLEAQLETASPQSTGSSGVIKSCSICGSVRRRFLPDSSMESCPDCADGILRTVE